MKASTVFLARISAGNGKFPFVKVQIKRDRPVAPKNASSYYVRYSGVRKDGKRGRIVQALASDKIEEAYVEFLNVSHAQQQIRAGQKPTFTAPDVPASQTLLNDAITDYIYAAKAIGNDEDTIGSKTRVLHSFLEVCFANGVSTIEAIREPKTGRRVLLAYLAWMKANLPTTKVDGARPENTHYSRMRRLGAFLNQHGIKIKKSHSATPNDPGLLAHSEFPKLKSKKPTKYSDDMIAMWLKAATVDEADLIWFFLATGFRDEEAAHCEWSDLNFADQTINVHAKPKTTTRSWSWKPKDDESRQIDIPLSADFVKRMRERKVRYASQKCALIFPTGVCKPDCNLVRIARRAATRAGITEHIGLHKIRKTFACYFAKKHGIELVRQLLGHSDIKTTQLYLSADSSDVQEMKASINDMTAAFTGNEA